MNYKKRIGVRQGVSARRTIDMNELPSVEVRDLETADLFGHFHVAKDDATRMNWREWWYFNFSTPDASGFVTIHTRGDLSAPKVASPVNVHSVVFSRAGSFIVNIPIESIAELIDESRPRGSPAMGLSLCSSPLTEDGQRAVTHLSLGRSRFDLHITDPTTGFDLDISGTYPMRGFSATIDRFGSAGDWMAWTVPSSRAVVNGSLSSLRHGLKGRVLSGLGYHDHNWGSWPADRINWDWFQISSARHDASAVFGAVSSGQTQGALVIQNGQDRQAVGLQELSLEFDQWKRDPDGVAYPGRSRLGLVADRGARISIDVVERFYFNEYGKRINAMRCRGGLVWDLSPAQETFGFDDGAGFQEYKHMIPLQTRNQ